MSTLLIFLKYCFLSCNGQPSGTTFQQALGTLEGIQVPNDPGAFEKASKLLANAGVNIEYAYGSAVDDHSMASIVAGVEDPQRAATAAGV